MQAERTQRRKLYNEIEDMKGKIRVYCRARPLSDSENARGNYSVVTSPDEYVVIVEKDKVKKEFQFDHIFMPDNTQDQVRCHEGYMAALLVVKMKISKRV